jgi:hypothetical protein
MVKAQSYRKWQRDNILTTVDWVLTDFHFWGPIHKEYPYKLLKRDAVPLR